MSQTKPSYKRISIALLVGFICVLTFVLRIPTFYAPFDAGYEYFLAFLGRQALVGNGFYSTSWSMKPPGESYTYGILYLLAGSEYWTLAVRIFSAFVGSLTTLMLFLLGRVMFRPWVGILAAIAWTILSSSHIFYGTAAYAECFMPLFTLFGFYLFFISRKKEKRGRWLFFSGLSLGVSLLYKQSAVFDFLPLFVYSLAESLSPLSKFNLKKLRSVIFYHFLLGLGFGLPLLIFVLDMLFTGRFFLFWDWAVYKPTLYGKIYGDPNSYIRKMWHDSYLIWELAVLSVLLTIFKFRKEKIFLLLWFVSGCLALVSSGKYWNYSFISLFLPASILASDFVAKLMKMGEKKLPLIELNLRKGLILGLFTASLASLTLTHYRLSFGRTFSYWKREISHEELRLQLSDGKRENERAIASRFLKQLVGNGDRVFVWDYYHPAIYVLVDIFPPYDEYLFSQQFWFPKSVGIGFTMTPSYQELESNRVDLMRILVEEPSDYIVLAVDSPAEFSLRIKEFPDFFSFVFDNYEIVYNYNDVWIYRRSSGELSVPKELVVDFDFAKNYFSVSTLSGNRVLLNPLAGDRGSLEAILAEGDAVDYHPLPLKINLFEPSDKDLVSSTSFNPSGVLDLHLRFEKGERPIRMVSVGKGKDFWAYPANGRNFLMAMLESGEYLDFYFEPLDDAKEGKYEVFVVYEDRSRAEAEISAANLLKR